MWLEGESIEKVRAYETIYYVMRTLDALLAPFIPHLSEEIYGNLRLEDDPVSVHMLDWAAGNPLLQDQELEKAMEVVRSFDEAQANARQAGKRKLRWPVEECVVITGSEQVAEAIKSLNHICRDRANARTVRVITGRWDRIGWRVEPVMKTLGPKFGRDAPKVKDLILSADANAMKAALDEGTPVLLVDANEELEILPSMVTFFEQLPEGLFSAPMQDAMVYVDVNLSPDLEAEGYSREVIRRFQEMRRQSDLRVEDFIEADCEVEDQRMADLISSWGEGIMGEVRARTLSIRTRGEPRPGLKFTMEKEWDIEGVTVTLALLRAPE